MTNVDLSTPCVCYWLYDNICTDPQNDGYVGISVCLPQRLARHRFNKQFPSNFKWKILFTGDVLECLAYELELRPDFNIGWNKDRGGNRGSVSRIKSKQSEATRRKKSIAMLLRCRTAETIEKRSVARRAFLADVERSSLWRTRMTNAFKGIPKSPEQRQKIADTLTGHVRTSESRVKQSNSTKGKPKSAEHRAKIAAAALRRYQDPAEHQRTSEAVKRGLADIDRSGAGNSMFGRTMSEETKQKIRDAIDERGGVSGSRNPNYHRKS